MVPVVRQRRPPSPQGAAPARGGVRGGGGGRRLRLALAGVPHDVEKGEHGEYLYFYVLCVYVFFLYFLKKG